MSHGKQAALTLGLHRTADIEEITAFPSHLFFSPFSFFLILLSSLSYQPFFWVAFLFLFFPCAHFHNLLLYWFCIYFISNLLFVWLCSSVKIYVCSMSVISSLWLCVMYVLCSPYACTVFWIGPWYRDLESIFAHWKYFLLLLFSIFQRIFTCSPSPSPSSLSRSLSI